MRSSGLRRTDERSADKGFTLVELLVGISLLGIVIGIGAGPWSNYQLANAHRGTADQAVSVLRNTQVAAVAERAVYRVDIATTQLVVFRVVGSVSTEVRRVDVEDRAITLVGPSFTKPDATTGSSAWFYPRGTASGGSLKVKRAGRDKEYTVTVEALTGRVSHD